MNPAYIKFNSSVGIVVMPVHAIGLETLSHGNEYLVRNVYTGAMHRVSQEEFDSIEKLLSNAK